MDKKEFNLRFLAELDHYRRDLKHLGTGSGYHPLLRQVLLWEVKDDIRQDGLEVAIQRWGHFIGTPQARGSGMKGQQE